MSCEHLVMQYSTFSKEPNDALKEPMFFGQPVNVARYDQPRYEIFEKLIEKQISFFWRPEEIDVSRDRIDYANLPNHEKHIFISNLKDQTLLDSIQGRSPNVGFLPLVSLPELETWIETWAFFETIHSRSYTHIIRNIVNDPSVVFDDIVQNEYIIARDEALHLTSTQHMLNLMRSGADDPDMAQIAVELQDECFELFKKAAEQEKEWAEYLFKDGSMIGLNKDILCQYVEYITNHRMLAVGLPAAFPASTQNPIPWINAWLSSDNVQVAPQEVEISSYLIGQIDAEVNADDLGGFEL